MMDIDRDKIDQAVLALMYISLDENNRAWKTFDWDTTSRLHEKGFLHDPANKTKSVLLTEEGVDEAKRLFRQLFEIR